MSKHQNAEKDLKVDFQAVICNATDTRYAHKKCNVHKHRIDCMRCFLRAYVAYFGFLIVSQACKPCICCVACVAYDSLESACRPMKTDLKVGFQAAVRTQCTEVMRHRSHPRSKNHNARNACTQKMPENATHARIEIESIACVTFFAYLCCVFQFFGGIASRAYVALRVLCMTAWKLHAGL